MFESGFSGSNAEKMQHGQDAQSVIEGILDEALVAGYIRSFDSYYQLGYPGRKQDQFYSPFLAVFPNGDKWAIFTSSSMRTDRVKQYFWDAEHLKKIETDIVKAYLVYSDDISDREKKEFLRLTHLITSGALYSTLDGVYSASAFREKIKRLGTSDKNAGFVKNAEGHAFERRLANSLASKANLRILKGTRTNSIPNNIDLLKLVLNSLDLSPTEIDYITATADTDIIGKLPTKGQPKTDVLANLFLYGESARILTISCKNSSSDSVSVAQFSADAICDAVDPTNGDLRRLLRKFQENGTVGAMSAKDAAELENELKPILRKFCMWVIGGIGGIGDPTTQWAYYVMICHDDPDDYTFWTTEDYVDHLIKNVQGNFGTPFNWTYPSKHRGEYIQFKAKIID